jgi:hypothetical protein
MECRNKSDGCIPFGTDIKGNDLWMPCAGKSCGGIVCTVETHSIIIKIGKEKKWFCRVCINTNNLPKSRKKAEESQ